MVRFRRAMLIALSLANAPRSVRASAGWKPPIRAWPGQAREATLPKLPSGARTRGATAMMAAASIGPKTCG